MKSIQVHSERAYQVTFTDSWSARLSELSKNLNLLVITPSSLASKVESILGSERILMVPDGEAQKSPKIFIDSLNLMALKGLDRRSLLVSIGGGATSDLTGFLAASYMRGIDWIAIPTTMAAMVDAAVGGKTAINIEAGKNLVGAFHSPSEVIIDLRWLNTLSERDLHAGLAESVKCGFIKDPEILELIEGNLVDNLPEIVSRSIQVKAAVVSSDFKESFEREALNYGHTLGHAIEHHSGFSLRHGEAISIGLCFAAELSAQEAGLSREIVLRHYSLLSKLGLPTKYQVDAFPALLELMRRDKKRQTGHFRFVTLRAFGETGRAEVSAETLSSLYQAHMSR